jgi:hypothetical protein
MLRVFGVEQERLGGPPMGCLCMRIVAPSTLKSTARRRRGERSGASMRVPDR